MREGLLAYINMVTVPHEMVGLERMLDYRDFTILILCSEQKTYNTYSYT